MSQTTTRFVILLLELTAIVTATIVVCAALSDINDLKDNYLIAGNKLEMLESRVQSEFNNALEYYDRAANLKKINNRKSTRVFAFGQEFELQQAIHNAPGHYEFVAKDGRTVEIHNSYMIVVPPDSPVDSELTDIDDVAKKVAEELVKNVGAKGEFSRKLEGEKIRFKFKATEDSRRASGKSFVAKRYEIPHEKGGIALTLSVTIEFKKITNVLAGDELILEGYVGLIQMFGSESATLYVVEAVEVKP